MEFYDLCLKPEGNLEEMVDTAERYDFSGVGIVKEIESGEDVESFAKSVRKRDGKREIELVPGCIISVESKKELRKSLDKVREKIELVMVEGGDFDVNKSAVRDSRVDLIVNPQYKRRDAGMDHKTTRMASQNDVAIGITIHPLVNTYGKVRSHVINHIRKNLRLCKKYNADPIVMSGAKDIYELRDPRELASLPQTLGFETDASMSMISSDAEELIEENRKKLSKETGGKGVEEVY